MLTHIVVRPHEIEMIDEFLRSDLPCSFAACADIYDLMDDLYRVRFATTDHRDQRRIKETYSTLVAAQTALRKNNLRAMQEYADQFFRLTLGITTMPSVDLIIFCEPGSQ